MRNLTGLLAVTAIASTFVVIDTAEAARRRSAGSLQTTAAPNNGTGTNSAARRNAASSGDAARAADSDPARSFGNYPDWARSAFSSRRGGR